MNKYKITESQKIDGLVRIFEEESPNIKITKEMQKIVNRVLFIGVILIISISGLLKNIPVIESIFIGIVVGSVFIYTMIKSSDILYNNSKKLGGRKYKILSKDSWYDIYHYNKDLISKNEEKFVEKILRVNKMYNTECMKEIINYLNCSKKSDKYDETNFLQIVVGVYAIPITFNIISVFSALTKLEMQQNIIVIAYILLFSITAVAVSYIVFVIKRIKMLSITNSYTYPKIIKILINLVIIKSMDN